MLTLKFSGLAKEEKVLACSARDLEFYVRCQFHRVHFFGSIVLGPEEKNIYSS